MDLLHVLLKDSKIITIYLLFKTSDNVIIVILSNNNNVLYINVSQLCT